MKSEALKDLVAQYPADVQRVLMHVLKVEKEFLSYQKGAATRKVRGPIDDYINEVASRSLDSASRGVHL